MPIQTRKSSPVFLRSHGPLARRALAWAVAALAAGCVTEPRRNGLSPHEFARVDHIAIHLDGEQPLHEYQVLDRIEATEYRMIQPLAPNTEFVSSVRARFALDTGERTSRWSGDWVGGNIRGYLFRTPG